MSKAFGKSMITIQVSVPESKPVNILSVRYKTEAWLLQNAD